MCGLSGAVGRVDPEVIAGLVRASEAQRHRGPDGDGLWRDAAEPPAACLAHRRLAILDLSEAGRQPMEDPETGDVLCYNGEVYNFAALRGELESLGARFRSRSDTEVILKAHAAWGDGATSRLRGMFAYAWWDARRRRVLLVRDRLGVKPLYFAELLRPGGGRVVVFASELRALLATGLVEPRLHPEAVGGYLWNGFVNGDQSIVRGIRAVPPGASLAVDDAGRLGPARRYWELPAPRPGGGAEAVEALGHELREAVQLRLVSDVPLGVFLSGGIDSSAVAALAARGGARIRTFNVGFPEAEYDESVHARAVAAALGAEHTEIPLDRARFGDQLGDALGALDQPSFDGINTYLVSRAVREAGITVALAGTGGDELFGGYRSFRDLPRAARWARALGLLPPGLVAAAAHGARALVDRGRAFPPQTRWGKLADALATRGRLLDLYQVSYALFTRAFLERLDAGAGARPADWVGLSAARRSALSDTIAGAPPLEAVSALELRSFVGERLLRDTDATSMASSLEARVPLLDHRVIEAAARVDSRRRYQPLGRKQLLRELALGDLPGELFERPKMGFVLPLEAWIRDALRPALEELFASRDACEAVGIEPAALAALWSAYRAGAPGLYWSRVWALFVLLGWARRHRASL